MKVALSTGDAHAIQLTEPLVQLQHIALEGDDRLLEARVVMHTVGIRLKVPVLAKDVDDAILLKLLGVLRRARKVLRDDDLNLALHLDPMRRVPHELGDIGALNTARLEVGLEGPHVEQPRHRVDVGDH